MKYALVNPNWSFDGSIYFGCHEPHLPLEYGYARCLIEAAGHEARIFDGHLFDLSLDSVRDAVADYRPDITVITTAPSYLFWRCAPPELRVPQIWAYALKPVGGRLVAVGPHGSTTPRAALRKLDADVVVMGECEDLLPRLAEPDWRAIPSLCYAESGEVRVQGGPHASAFTDLPALLWEPEWIRRHAHHHHRFDSAPAGPGAELEASRGCPYSCSFCAKENFRDKYRRRPLTTLLEELDHLVALGVEYVYFIDEIFLPNRPLLEALVERPVVFGVQTRIDLWKPDMLALLGRAGCVSVEAGVESLTEEGRAFLQKNCRTTTEDLTERLLLAKQHIPFVQGNLIEVESDNDEEVQRWRDRVRAHGVWANDPVPLFPYPGSPDYRRLWGLPDDHAWERAHAHYLRQFAEMSEIQDQKPVPLAELELSMDRS